MPHRLVFLGNCQASALSVAFNIFAERTVGHGSVHIDWRQTAGREAEINTAECVVLQVSDLDWKVPDYVSPASKLVLFPYVSGGFLWPYANEEHPHYWSAGMHRYGVFGEDGDAFLNRMIRYRIDPDAAVAGYMAMDPRRMKLDRRLELTMDLQRQRDRIAGIDVADQIEANYRHQHLFLGRGHLCDYLARHMAREVFKRLNLPREVIAGLDHPVLAQLYSPGEHPVHPAIAEHFGLSYARQGHRFRTLHTLVTFEEFCRKYMLDDFNEPIFSAMAAARRQESPEIVIPLLEQALALHPSSVTVRVALAKQFYLQNQRDKCFPILHEASRMDPPNIEPLEMLANLYRETQNADAIETIGQQILLFHPGHAHGNHLLRVARSLR